MVGSTLTVELGSLVLSGFFQMDVNTIVNPGSTTPTSSFEFETEDAAGNLLDFKYEDLTLVASSETLQDVILTTSSQIVAEDNTLTVTVTVRNPVPVGGIIKMSNPSIDYGFGDYLLDGWTVVAGS